MKYLVTYKLNNEVFSTIYETEGDMTEQDVKTFGYVMLSFNKLSDKEKTVKHNNKPAAKLAAFVLNDKKCNECVLVYAPIDDVVSYTFERDKMMITLKQDNNQTSKKYICGIPGIWIGDENVMELVPKGLRDELGSPVLYSSHYDGYETITR